MGRREANEAERGSQLAVLWQALRQALRLALCGAGGAYSTWMSTAMRRGRMAMALGNSVCWKKTMAAVHQQIASRLSTMRRSSSSMAARSCRGEDETRCVDPGVDRS